VYAAHVLIGLSLAALAAGGETDAALLRRAEEAFGRGAAERGDPDKARRHFAAAAACYEALRRRGAANAELFRNQGNAALLADQLPQAILAYRRALERAPHDRGLRADLEYAREQVQYPAPEASARPPADEGWPSWLPGVDSDYLLAGALALYALACVCFTRRLMTESGPPLERAALLLFLAVLVGGLWGYLQWQAWRAGEAEVVVVSAERVPLRRGNGATYPSHPRMPMLHRGMEARLLHRRGGWLQIEMSGGAVGWVPATAALVDED
jgi:hypothetical protein